MYTKEGGGYRPWYPLSVFYKKNYHVFTELMQVSATDEERLFLRRCFCGGLISNYDLLQETDIKTLEKQNINYNEIKSTISKNCNDSE